MMHSLVIGATGRTGQEFTRLALEAGHQITALVRSPEKMDNDHQHLKLITGDGLDYDSVETAVSTHDFHAIVLLIGGGLTTKTLNTDVTRNVMKAMKAKSSTAHLWILSAAGTGDSYDQMPFFGKLLRNTLLRAPFADHEVQEKEVMNSGLSYTIVRPVGLTNGPLTEGKYLALETQKARSSQISRANVAHYIVSNLGNDRLDGRAVLLCEK